MPQPKVVSINSVQPPKHTYRLVVEAKLIEDGWLIADGAVLINCEVTPIEDLKALAITHCMVEGFSSAIGEV